MILEEHLQQIRDGIRRGGYANEASVSQGIVLRILQSLEWPTFDTQIVCPEYSLEGRRVDFGLCHPPSKPIAFIEVKQIGQSEQAERQLFEYAFHVGIPLAILTDGQQWNFFLPAEQGSYGERRVYKLDIVERDLSECVSRLKRYLGYDAISSGAAIDAARADYKNISRERQMLSTLPKAWKMLVDEEDEQLLELVADRVESLCGFKPELDTIAAFMKARVELKSAPELVPQITGRRLPKVAEPDAAYEPRPDSLGSVGFVLNGKKYAARNGRDVLVSIFKVLADRDPTFLDRFAALPKHGRTRRYLSREQGELYPGRPDLVHEFSQEVKPGWWLGINLSHAAIARIAEMACGVAGIEFGRDMVVSLAEN
jgi:hypothetical protein